MDGLQVSTDSPKYTAERVVPPEPYFSKTPVGEKHEFGPDHQPTTHNPFGLGSVAFGLLVAAITCILTAAIVGGAVGGALGSKHNAVVTTTPSSLPANNYEPLSAASVNTTYFPYCPDQDGQTITTLKDSATYELQCNSNAYGVDAMAIVAYSLDDCVQACTTLNTFNTITNCVGVNFWADMASSFYSSGGNCYLKTTFTYTVDASGSPQVWAKLK